MSILRKATPHPPYEPPTNQVQIGSYLIDLPLTWSDRTIHTFVAPRVVDPRQSPHLRMRGGFRENLSISRERIHREISPQEYLQQQIEELKPRLQRFRLLYEQPLYIANHNAHSIAYQFSLHGQNIDVCQLRIALSIEYEMLVLTGTASAHVFENKKQIFLQIAQSLKLPTVYNIPDT